MNRKVYQNINLTCIFQNTQPAPVAQPAVVTGMLSNIAGGMLFQETLPRRRDIRNARLYEGQFVSVVRRKDGLYYPFLKGFRPENILNKQDYAFRIYAEISEALNSIE